MPAPPDDALHGRLATAQLIFRPPEGDNDMAEDRLATGFAVDPENTAGRGVFAKIGDMLGGNWSACLRSTLVPA